MNFLEWVGASFLFLLFLVIGLALIGWTIAEVKGFRDRREWRIQVAACENFKQRLISDAWWFSEDKPTTDLIVALASRQDTAQIREEWRKARGSA